MSISEAMRTAPQEQGSRPPTGAVYFLSVSVSNARCFGDKVQSLNLADENGQPARWTIVLGNNGTGKTTLLQSIVGFEEMHHAGSDRLFPGYLRLLSWNLYEHRIDFIRDQMHDTFLSAKVSRGLGITTNSSELEIRELTMTFTKDGGRNGFFARNFFPHCFAYGAGRRLGKSALAGSEIEDPTMSLFFDDADLLNAEEWLLRLDYSGSKPSDIQVRQRNRLVYVKELLINILPDVTDIRVGLPTTERPNPSVEFKTPYAWVRLGQLGYGYRTLIAWMVDFASRMFDRYPDSPDPLAEPAVVLVDEIDLHLHPKWQRELISYLTERFPNTQFIVTAHSPLIVQAALGVNANIAVLRRDGDHVVIDNDKAALQGMTIDQLLTSDFFELPSARPPNLDAPLNRRRELLSKPKLTKKDQAELAELEKRIGILPIGDSDEQARKMMALVEETHKLLRKPEKKTK